MTSCFSSSLVRGLLMAAPPARPDDSRYHEALAQYEVGHYQEAFAGLSRGWQTRVIAQAARIAGRGAPRNEAVPDVFPGRAPSPGALGARDRLPLPANVAAADLPGGWPVRRPRPDVYLR